MKPQEFLYGAVEINMEDSVMLWDKYFNYDNEILKLTGWKSFKPICHHMTIGYYTTISDNTYKWLLDNNGLVCNLKVIAIGFSDKACALQVKSNVISENKIKHITLATNPDTNGKPVDSNNITEWYILKEPYNIKGEVKIYYK